MTEPGENAQELARQLQEFATVSWSTGNERMANAAASLLLRQQERIAQLEATMPDERKPQPDESFGPYRLRLITGTGKVLWERSLSSPYPLTGIDAKGFWSEVRLDVFSALAEDWDTPTSSASQRGMPALSSPNPMKEREQ